MLVLLSRKLLHINWLKIYLVCASPGVGWRDTLFTHRKIGRILDWARFAEHLCPTYR